jgi:putative endonuclease
MKKCLKKNFLVYLVKTSKNKLYTGITNNLDKRIKAHNDGKGAKSLRGQLPVKLVWSSNLMSKSEALKLEYKIKQMSRKQKEQFIKEKK